MEILFALLSGAFTAGTFGYLIGLDRGANPNQRRKHIAALGRLIDEHQKYIDNCKTEQAQIAAALEEK